MQNSVNRMTAVFRCDGRMARMSPRSTYGMSAAPTSTNVGTRTPATVG